MIPGVIITFCKYSDCAIIIIRTSLLYLIELNLVQIYAHPNDDGTWLDVSKFRPIGDDINVADNFDLSGWPTPEVGRLRSFRLYGGPR